MWGNELLARTPSLRFLENLQPPLLLVQYIALQNHYYSTITTEYYYFIQLNCSQ